MKKVLLTVALALMPMLTIAQDAFDRFEKEANVTSLVVGKKSFQMLAATKLNAENEKAAEVIKTAAQVESLRVYTTEDAALSTEMKSVVNQYVKSAGLEPLMEVNDKGKKISIRIKEGAAENLVTEVLVFVEGTPKEQETVILSIKGNFDLNKLAEMMETKSVTGDSKTDEKQLEAIKEGLHLKVQPNPTGDVFFINTDKPSQVKLYDLSGRMVKSEDYSASGISVEGLEPATYVVEITTGDKKQTQKIVVK